MSKRIAFLSKYPPLEGGIAAKTYWMARGLAAAGHIVHVITYGVEAGVEYQIQHGESSAPEIPNLQVHRPQNEIPWHLPEHDEQALALLDLTIEMIRSHNVQILDTGYLIPYGIVGHLAKLSTGVCHVIRHGGSDLERFLKQRILVAVLDEAIAGANMIITDENHRHLFEKKTSNVVCQPPYVPDGKMFVPNGNSQPRHCLAAIGKVNYYWQHKNLDLVVNIMLQMVGQFECRIIGQGKGMSEFQKSLGSDVVSTISWFPFVPPWEMPELLNQLDAVFIFESALPHPVVSNLALEALCSGVGIITDRTDFVETYQDLMDVSKSQVLVVSPSEPSSVAEKISHWVLERGWREQPSRQLIDYHKYLSATEVIYNNLLDSKQS